MSGGRETLHLERPRLGVVESDDVGERGAVDYSNLAALFGELGDERARQVLLGGQQAESFLGSRRHARGIRSDEQRPDRGRLAGKLRDVQGQMMPFEAPGPGRGSRRVAEHAGEVQAGIAARRHGRARGGLDAPQDVLVLDDAARFEQAFGTEGRGQQRA
jgi:hypothetical protein